MTRSTGSDRFTTIRPLGSGGFAEVLLARDNTSGRSVVLKRPLSNDSDSRDQLTHEFAAVAPLDHPGIARALDLVLDSKDGGPCLLFEAIEGVPSTLAAPSASVERVLAWTAGVAETLVFLHGQNLIHGDLKPDNILIATGDRPRLIDFGLARVPGGRGGGTAATAAPEVLRGDPAGPAADLFSLGATVYFWLLGRYPFGGRLASRLATLDRRAVFPAEGTLPGGVHKLLRSLLSPQPGERPESALVLAAQLSALGAALPDAAYSDPSSRARALPLIARGDVLEAMRDVWEGATSARLLWLCGPRGSGRTRLLQEAARRARIAGRRVIAVDANSTLHLSSALIGGRASVAASLAALAESGPTSVLIDDADLLAPEQREELIAAAKIAHGAGDLVVVAGGGSASAGWSAIEIPALTLEQVAELTRALLPGPQVPLEIARRLARVSDGKPGHVVALLGEAVRTGLAVNRGLGGWDLTELARRALPAVLTDTPESETPVVSLAGVDRVIWATLYAAGEPLSLTDLAAAAELSLEHAATALRALRAKEITIRRPSGEVALRFQDARGVAIDPPELTPLHSRLLQLLARRAPISNDDRPVWLSQLARHASSAGKRSLAARLTRRAVCRAVQFGRPDIAGTILAAAAPPETVHDRAWLEEASGEIALALGRADAACSPLMAAAESWLAAHSPDRAAQLFARLSRALGDAGRTAEASQAAARALALATRERTRAAAWLEQAILAARRGTYPDALERCERAAASVLMTDPVWRRAHAARGRCLVLLDRLGEAEEAFRLAERAADAGSDVQLSAIVRLARLQAALRGGRIRETLDLVPETRRLLLARGDADGLALLSSLASQAAQASADWPRAAAEAESSVRWREIHGHSGWLATALLRWARLCLLLGDLPRARGAARRVIDAANATESERCEGNTLLAQLAAVEGDPQAASAAAKESQTSAAGIDHLVPIAALAHAWAAWTNRDRELVARALEPVADHFEAHSTPPELAAPALALLAWSFSKTRPAQARRTAERARALADRIGDLDAALLAHAAEEDAARSEHDEPEASRAAAARRSRLRDAAARVAGSAWSGSFMSRPDRAPQLDSAATSVADRKRLDALYEIVADLNSLREPQAVIGALLDRALEAIGAERGAVILVGEQGDLRLVQSRQVEEQTAHDALALSRSIVARARGGETVLAVDPANDPRFKSVQSVAMFSIRAVLCVPLSLKSRVVGALYVDTCNPRVRFSQADLAFAEALANHAALALENARLFRRLMIENEQLRAELGTRDRLGGLAGRSASMHRTMALIESLAPSGLPVLIRGESGTGKELAARQLHRLGPTPDGPFIVVGAASLPPTILEATLFGHEKGAFTGADRARRGLLAEAHEGTLFLDEVAELPLGVQAKLLRVLEERCVRPLGSHQSVPAEFRLVSASQVDLQAEVRAGRFRHDLLYRVDVLHLTMPPLRERLEDLPLLATQILERLTPQFGVLTLQHDLLELFSRWSWPGNVREYENVLTRLALRATKSAIGLEALALDPELSAQFGGQAAAPTLANLEAVERDAIRRALEFCRGNRERAAKMLGVGRATIFRKIRQYNLEETGRGPAALSPDS
ncbi:MAG: sigma 54-interacting transcriptional regulator [Acidobacteriota bacterium]